MNRRISALFFATIFAGLPIAPAQSAQQSVVPRMVNTLHIILVFDVDAVYAENLGILQDQKTWSETLGSIATNLGLEDGKDFTLTVIDGERATPDEIRKAFKALKVRPQKDGIVFIYSGHGTYNSVDGHLLEMHEKRSIRREEIRRMMVSKNAALSVLITDCCAELVPVPAHYQVSDPPSGQKMCESLFYYHRGFVDINSSEIGKVSYGNKVTGGTLSHAFRRLLYGARLNSEKAESSIRQIAQANQWSDVTWRKFSSLLGSEVREISNGAQSPHFFSLPGGYLGVHARRLPPEGRPAGIDGVLVHKVLEESPAAAAGLSAFDLRTTPQLKIDAELIVGINGYPVRNLQDFEQLIDRCDGRVKMDLRNPINNGRRSIDIKLDENNERISPDKVTEKKGR